jgi:hypothetical protein
MGSNVSREKGLNRRSVSSGHLDAPLPKIAKVRQILFEKKSFENSNRKPLKGFSS